MITHYFQPQILDASIWFASPKSSMVGWVDLGIFNPGDLKWSPYIFNLKNRPLTAVAMPIWELIVLRCNNTLVYTIIKKTANTTLKQRFW